jgi:hypothetical protein
MYNEIILMQALLQEFRDNNNEYLDSLSMLDSDLEMALQQQKYTNSALRKLKKILANIENN